MPIKFRTKHLKYNGLKLRNFGGNKRAGFLSWIVDDRKIMLFFNIKTFSHCQFSSRASE